MLFLEYPRWLLFSVRLRGSTKYTQMNIAIVGAGIIGVTSALAIKEALPKAHVTIYGELFSPETTGDGSAGLWGPFIVGDTPEVDFLRWSGVTHRWMENFWRKGLAPETGVSLIPVVRVTKKKVSKIPSWGSIVYGTVAMSNEEILQLNEEKGSNYKSGLRFVTYTAEPTRLLPWLMNKFISAGGIIRNKKINTFDELAKDGYDTVINCCGLGARELANDPLVLPVRGQVMRVKAPWIFSVFISEDSPGNYIIPNIDNAVLGGTSQRNDYDLNVRETDSKFIHDGCQKILPALEGCEIVKEWVGLRPSRTRIRLEEEYLPIITGKKLLVIHNYGHGGSGVTVCWGCALNVVELLKKTIDKRLQVSSKL